MTKYFNVTVPGHNIRCKLYYEQLPAKRAIIFGTGFAGHKDNRAAATFAEKALSKYKDLIIVVFNWPAHGDDVKKKLVLDDCDIYLEQVIEAVKAKYGVQDIYSYATSFGGYLILKYISEHGNPFQKIALRCPAIDMYDVLTRTIMKTDEYDKILKGENVPVGFDRKIIVTQELLESLKTHDIQQYDYLDDAEKILILHGTKDEVVPFESGREFADENLIEFIPIEGADHRFMNPAHMNQANKYVLEFFDL